MSKFFEKTLSSNASREAKDAHYERLKTLIKLCDEVLREEYSEIRRFQLIQLIGQLDSEINQLDGDPEEQTRLKEWQLRLQEALDFIAQSKIKEIN